jgi:iron complex outermembrane receptor protein
MRAAFPSSLRHALLAGLLAASSLARAEMQLAARDLADLSLEELADLHVTSAALRPERLLQAPASIFVITNDDIRRAGATSIPEALRLAPNLEVAQVSATSWAITARGFQNVITNKLLVLIDGRTIYTTVLSGVLWDAQDLMLEDVERIEVISGPGAALFGANAFTGVINIITRSSTDTQGNAVVAGVGSINGNVSARHGGKLGDSGTYRIYAMHIERDDLRPDASRVADAMRKDGLGFRADFDAWGGRGTVQGDGYDARVTGNGAQPVKLSGGNVLGRWTGVIGGGTQLKLQSYYDYTNRDDPATFIDRVGTFDIEGQLDFPAWGAHRVSATAGYRYAIDNTTPNAVVRFIPEDQRLHWASAAAQDEITLSRELTLTLGAKAQSQVYVPTEFMPDVRLAWTPSPKSLAWVAATRVARTPGRIDRDFFFPGNPPFIIEGGPNFVSEIGNVYEVGYRTQVSPSLTASVTVFYSQLDRLRGGTIGPDGAAVVSNEVEGTTSGIEAWAMYQVTERWRFTAGLLELHQDLRDKNGSGDLNGPSALGNDPRHTVRIRSMWRARDDLDVDLSWRYVSSLAYLTTVPSYSATDLRVAWRPHADVELSVLGANLFDKTHVEFDEHGLPAPIPRSVYAQVRWVF